MHHPPGPSPLHSARRRPWRRLLSRRNRSQGRPASRIHHLPALLFVLLVLIQNFEPHMCRQLMRPQSSGMGFKDKSLTIGGSAAGEVTSPEAESKRAAAGRSAPSQPEEIFSAPADDSGLSYDEYPMVVPKRAALLLDRLMVALHHALEQERTGQRIGDLFAEKNNFNDKVGEYPNEIAEHQTADEGMYSEDDPTIDMNYDFRNVNEINRATGETLMAKSFQRRAGAESAGADRTGASSMSGSPVGQRRIQSSGSGGGRMYWRCYFNAVSCF
ncbi:hypothetical protein KR009_007444 [Drosophila setifemur]|nr:hypothetical protein KR009_007444 [Drosophila setifemur]